MKRIYTEPDIELLYIESKELIRTSSDLEDNETERLPLI